METQYNNPKLWNTDDIYANHGGEIRDGTVFTLMILRDLERPWVSVNSFSWFDNIMQAAGYFKYVILADEILYRIGYFESDADADDAEEFEREFKKFIDGEHRISRKHRKYIEMWKDTNAIFDADPDTALKLFDNLINKFNAVSGGENDGERFYIFENIYEFNAFVNKEFSDIEGFDAENFNRSCCMGKISQENFADFMMPLNITCNSKQFYKSAYTKNLRLICCITWLQTLLILVLSRRIFNGNAIQSGTFSQCVVAFSVFVTALIIAKAIHTSQTLRKRRLKL